MRLPTPTTRSSKEKTANRFDINIEEDLIEEVVRVVGYDQMPSHRLHSTDAIGIIPEKLRSVQDLKQQLSGLAYQEVINYSFVGEKSLSDIKLDTHAFPLANPLNKEMAVMRTHLLPGVLANIKANLARQEHCLALEYIYLTHSPDLQDRYFSY